MLTARQMVDETDAAALGNPPRARLTLNCPAAERADVNAKKSILGWSEAVPPRAPAAAAAAAVLNIVMVDVAEPLRSKPGE